MCMCVYLPKIVRFGHVMASALVVIISCNLVRATRSDCSCDYQLVGLLVLMRLLIGWRTPAIARSKKSITILCSCTRRWHKQCCVRVVVVSHPLGDEERCG
jgi:hypothetical protein